MSTTNPPPSTVAGGPTPTSTTSKTPTPKRCIWIYGLPASGKTTLGEAVVSWINKHAQQRAILLDGDEIRKTMWPEYGWSPPHRLLHTAKLASMADYISRHGIIPVVAEVTPYTELRRHVRAAIHSTFLVEMGTPPGMCEFRDPNGLWKKARHGEIENFTGVSDPFDKGSESDYDWRTPEKFDPMQQAMKIIIRANPLI